MRCITVMQLVAQATATVDSSFLPDRVFWIRNTLSGPHAGRARSPGEMIESLIVLPKPKSAAFSTKQREILLRILTLVLVCVVSFSIRLFSVLRYESIIHEFDPWFNFRSTRYVLLYPYSSLCFWPPYPIVVFSLTRAHTNSGIGSIHVHGILLVVL